MGLGLWVSTRRSTALTLVGSRCAEAQSGGLLQRALLRKVSRLPTSVTLRRHGVNDVKHRPVGNPKRKV
jgi:hypothetical protein